MELGTIFKDIKTGVFYSLQYQNTDYLTFKECDRGGFMKKNGTAIKKTLFDVIRLQTNEEFLKIKNISIENYINTMSHGK